MFRVAATALTVPPTNLAVLILLAAFALFWPPARRVAQAVILVCASILLALSLPIVGMTLLASLEPGPVSAPSQSPSAIIILGGDVEKINEAPQVVMGPISLERVRTGAVLARSTGLPMLVSGGIVNHTAVPVATLMQASLTTDFGIPPRWIEATSVDTWENAEQSAKLLRSEGVTSVFLVTHAWHMRRALFAFRRVGIEAIPVPVRHDPEPTWAASEFVPRPSAWLNCFFAMHEWIGLAWYSVRG